MKIEIFQREVSCDMSAKYLKLSANEYLCIDWQGCDDSWNDIVGRKIVDSYGDLGFAPVLNADIKESQWYKRDPFLAEFFLGDYEDKITTETARLLDASGRAGQNMEMTRFSVTIPRALYKEFKIRCIKHEEKMKDAILQMVAAYVDAEHLKDGLLLMDDELKDHACEP